MDYLVKSTKWTKNDGIETWWGPNRSGYTTYINEAGVYSEEEAKYLQDIHGKKVCVAIPYNENMVKKGIMQLEKRIKFHEKEIARSEEYIKNDKAKIEVLNSKISKLKERIIKQS